MGKVVVVGAGRQQARLIDQSLADATVHVERRRWATFLRDDQRERGHAAGADDAPELVICDLTGTDAPRTEALARFASRMPGVSVLYLSGDLDAERLEGLAPALQAPNVDFVLSPQDPRELRLRAGNLLARRRSAAALTRESVRIAPCTGTGLLQHTVPALRAANGRLDARAVSALFGIPLAALARALGRSEQAVHKTPAAVSLQEPLRLYERIAAALLRLVGSEEAVRIWMNAPNPELEGDSPLQLLLTGEGEVVADLLEAAATGEPA